MEKKIRIGFVIIRILVLRIHRVMEHFISNLILLTSIAFNISSNYIDSNRSIENNSIPFLRIPLFRIVSRNFNLQLRIKIHLSKSPFQLN